MRGRILIRLPALLPALLLPAGALFGQAGPATTFALTVGASAYDLSGTGTGSQAGARVGVPLTRSWAVEAGGTYFQYESQSADNIHALLPELSARATADLGGARVFGVAGAGLGWFDMEDRNETDLTLHVGLGLDVPVRPAWGIRAEARLRSVDPWTGSMLDFGVGLRTTL